MSKAVHHIVDSGEDRDIHVVPGKDLGRLVDEEMPFFEIFDDVLFHKVIVDIGSPGISI